MTSHGIKKLLVLSRAVSFIFCILLGINNTFSQKPNISHVLVTNFVADGHVVEITAPTEWIGHQVVIAWKNKEQQTYAHPFFIKKGKSTIRINDLDGWRGNIDVLATTDNRLSAHVVPKRWTHDIEFFMKPNLLTPGSINFDNGYKFGGIQFSYLMIALLLLISGLCFVLKKKRFYTCLLIGFLVVWYLLDVRQIKNHLDRNTIYKENSYQLSPFEGFESFYDNCKTTIKDDTWRLQPLSGVWNSYAKYRLAGLKYAPVNKKTGREPEFLITPKPNKREQLITNQGVALVRLKKK